MKILKKGQYYGTKQSEVNLPRIVLSEYDYLANQTDWHYHENPYFMYVLNGDVYDINKKTESHCSSGSLVFHNWQEIHFNKKHSLDARGFHIEFQRDWFEEKKLDLNLWEGSQLINHPNLHHILGKIYFEFRCKDQYSHLSIELLLLQLCENMQEIQLLEEQPPSWFKRLKQLLHEEPENLSLDSLSKQLGVHPVHISRAVPKYLASSLGEYLRLQKVKQALGYLFKAHYTLTEITFLCGFSDQSHFTRTFKRYMGVTPLQFYKKCSKC